MARLRTDLRNLIIDKIESIDFDIAKEDVIDFLQETDAVDIWSKGFFSDLAAKLKSV